MIDTSAYPEGIYGWLREQVEQARARGVTHEQVVELVHQAYDVVEVRLIRSTKEEAAAKFARQVEAGRISARTAELMLQAGYPDEET